MGWGGELRMLTTGFYFITRINWLLYSRMMVFPSSLSVFTPHLAGFQLCFLHTDNVQQITGETFFSRDFLLPIIQASTRMHTYTHTILSLP